MSGAENSPAAVTVARARTFDTYALWLKAVVTLIAIAAVVASYFVLLDNARVQARARAEENMRSVSVALAQHIERTIEQADQISG